MKEEIYCSLDIETSGFDPKVAELLEVGCVFFKIKNGEFQILEEYTRLVRPQKEVPKEIFDLTGIDPKELSLAPELAEVREEIKSKITGVTVVGHNIAFDLNFLKALNIENDGEILDTLDIVQFILPTHHSYNLENLGHVFGLNYKNAHRALVDSRATMQLLEKMLAAFSEFPENLKKQMVGLMEKHSAPCLEVFKQFQKNTKGLKKVAAGKNRSVLPGGKDFQKLEMKIKTGGIYSFPPGTDFLSSLAADLGARKSKFLLVVPSLSLVFELWKKGLAESLIPRKYFFSEEKFQKFLDRESLGYDEVKFALKILVWKTLNWQSRCFWDLNLSFFGGQFTQAIAASKASLPKNSQLVCVDYETLLDEEGAEWEDEYFAVLVGLNEFEKYVSAKAGGRISWGYLNFHLKSIYNPETGFGQSEYKDQVTRLLEDSDLFFGLVGALLRKQENFSYVKVSDADLDSGAFLKISAAAGNLVEKIKQANKILSSTELEIFATRLAKFFSVIPNTVKWIEFTGKGCNLCYSSLRVDQDVKKALGRFKKICFVDSLGSESLLKYFAQRLGLEGYSHYPAGFKNTALPVRSPALLKQTAVQGDLFGAGAGNEAPPKTLLCRVCPFNLKSPELMNLLSLEKLPAALLLGSPSEVREFHETNQQELKSFASVLAQSGYGGSRIIRNFGIYPNGLLIATDKFILKNIPRDPLKVKTLIICHLPFEQFTHPYQEAIAGQFKEPFLEYSIPRAVYNFHCLIKSFNTETLKEIYLCDQKFSKPYAAYFLDYLRLYPGLELVMEGVKAPGPTLLTT